MNTINFIGGGAQTPWVQAWVHTPTSHSTATNSKFCYREYHTCHNHVLWHAWSQIIEKLLCLLSRKLLCQLLVLWWNSSADTSKKFSLYQYQWNHSQKHGQAITRGSLVIFIESMLKEIKHIMFLLACPLEIELTSSQVLGIWLCRDCHQKIGPQNCWYSEPKFLKKIGSRV